jgi:hypothetical protein
VCRRYRHKMKVRYGSLQRVILQFRDLRGLRHASPTPAHNKHRQSMKHQEVRLATTEDDRDITYSPRTPSGNPPQSASDEAVATGYHSWNPRSEGACRSCHNGPLSSEKVKMAEMTGKEGHHCSCLRKSMKVAGERAGA